MCPCSRYHNTTNHNIYGNFTEYGFLTLANVSAKCPWLQYHNTKNTIQIVTLPVMTRLHLVIGSKRSLKVIFCRRHPVWLFFPLRKKCRKPQTNLVKKSLPVSFLNILEYFKLLTQCFFQWTGFRRKFLNQIRIRTEVCWQLLNELTSPKILSRYVHEIVPSGKWFTPTKNSRRYSLQIVNF